MPTICLFRGIKIFINYSDHAPPHFHATYGGYTCSVLIRELEVLDGDFPKKQLKMLLGWAALRQDELMENWQLATENQATFEIDPLR
jgi:hypothetical protein